MNRRNLIVSTTVVVIVAIIGVRYFKTPEEKIEQPEALVMPMPPEATRNKPAIRRPGPEPSHEVQRRCMEKYPKDAFARHACEQGVIGISDEERIRKLNEAWNSGLNARKQ